LDIKEEKISKGPKFPFSYIRNMAIKSNGTFYNPFSVHLENNAIIKKDYENKCNHQENVPSNMMSHNFDDKTYKCKPNVLANPANLYNIEISQKNKIRQNNEKISIHECKIKKF